MKKNLLIILIGAAVVAGAYYLGKSSVGTAARNVDVTRKTDETVKAHAAAGNAKVGSLKQSVRFNVGSRNVKAILVDGTVTWVGTSNGLIRFNRVTGKDKTFDNASGLLSSGIFYLGKINGELWVGTYGGGLSILNEGTGKWRNYNIPNGMGDAFVYGVLPAKNGDVWIATWSGANRIVGGNLDDYNAWELYTVANTNGGLPNDWVYGLDEGRDGTIWFATEGGLARWVDGKWDNWQHEDGLGAPYEKVKDDMAFMSDPGKVSAHHARQKVEMGLTDISVAYNPNYIVALQADDDGSVWAGTWGAGLSHFDGEKWSTYTVGDGLPSNHVFSLNKDKAGRLWVGTGKGLGLKTGDGAFKTFGTDDGVYVEAIFSMDFDKNGNAWYGGYGELNWFPNGILK